MRRVLLRPVAPRGLRTVEEVAEVVGGSEDDDGSRRSVLDPPTFDADAVQGEVAQVGGKYGRDRMSGAGGDEGIRCAVSASLSSRPMPEASGGGGHLRREVFQRRSAQSSSPSVPGTVLAALTKTTARSRPSVMRPARSVPRPPGPSGAVADGRLREGHSPRGHALGRGAAGGPQARGRC